jgi:amidase
MEPCAQKTFPGLLGKGTNLSWKLHDDYNKALQEQDVLILPNLPYIANNHTNPVAPPIELIAKQVDWPVTGNYGDLI